MGANTAGTITGQGIKVAVVGAGAMGGYFASLIAERGGDVSLVDVDASRMAAIRAEGLRIEDAAGDRFVSMHAGSAQDLAGPVGLVIVFTKGMHTAAAAEAVRHAVNGDTWFLTLQNGLGNPELIASLYPGNRVAAGVTDVPADLVGPSHIRSHGPGSVRFWSLDGAHAPMVDRICDLLGRCGIPAQADPAVREAVWEKVAFNAALNAVTALSRRPVGALDNPDGRHLIAAIVGEVVSVASAAGVGADHARVMGKIEFALANHVTHEPSMLQDVRAGRQTEVEMINGAIVRLARDHGIAVPVNETVTRLLRLTAGP